MRRLGNLVLSTALLGPTLVGSALTGGAALAAGPPHPGHSGGSSAWQESVVDADQSFRGLDAVNRRTAWVAGGSLTEGGPGRVFRTTDGGGT